MRNVRLGALLAILTATFPLASGCSDDSSAPSNDGAGGNDDGTGGGGDAGAGGDGGDAGAGGSGGGTEQPGSVEILAAFGDVVVGGQTPMRALVRDHTGKVLGGRALSWASDTPSVATVDPETGIVTGVGEGKATISVTSEGATGSVEVQVEPAVAEPSYVHLWAYSSGECVLTRAGRLYCRHLDVKSSSPEWEPISPERRFKRLVSIYDQLITLDVDGRIYSFDRDAPEPKPVATEVRFNELVATYAGYTAALSEDGSLYESIPSVPTLVPLDAKLASISMSEAHGLALTADGRVFSWANYGCGAFETPLYLGVPKAGGQHPCTPTEIESPVPFTSVAAGSDISFGLDADGVAYAWGRRHRENPTGSVGMAMHGRGEDAEPSSTPLPLATDERFVRIVAGWRQAAGLRADGVPFFWGYDVPGYGTAGTFFAPTEMPDARIAALSVSITLVAIGWNHWGAFEPDGSLFLFADNRGPHRTYLEQAPRYLGGETQRLTLERGGRVELAIQPFTEAETLTANGFAFPSREIALAMGRDWGEPNTSGKLEHQGVSFELVPKAIQPGQAATVLVIEASDTAVLGEQQIWVGSQNRAKEWAGSATVDVWVAPPEPPPGTPLDLRCGMPESIVHGYWCLTNSGGATAPHKWKDLPLAGSTWRYENLCISYGEGGRGAARFKNPNGTVGERAIRYGVLSKANGEPEAGAGHWLLFHEGIGDPQVEQLPFNPSTGAVGESWPFTKGSCSF